MGPFALPVPAFRLGQEKRKRKRRQAEEEDEKQEALSPPSPDSPTSSSHLPADSINPRSHSPNTLRQFAVAGLDQEEEVPSKLHPSFPHKALPPDYPNRGHGRRRKDKMTSSGVTSGSETDVDADASDKHMMDLASNYSAHLEHLNTMTTIMHRCLHDGDIKRAKRAFGLLIRMKAVDIRVNNMWNIGTEILMRDDEEKGRTDTGNRGNPYREGPSQSGGNDDENENRSRLRWGTTANVDKVRTYLETLAMEYPYDKHRPQQPSAIDFWPALFSIEIYNVDAEFKHALHQLDKEAESAPPQDEDNNSDPPLSQNSGGLDEDEDYEDMRMRRREDASNKQRWAAKDEIRRTTQEAAQQVAASMDKQMENSPYQTHLELLRLRGMLALFIADLYLPSRIVERQGLEIQMKGLSLHGKNLRKQTEHYEDKGAVERREQEVDKARVYFRKFLENRGQLEPWLDRFLNPDDDEDDKYDE